MVPAPLLEGYQPDPSPSLIAECTRLDREVRALHQLARSGAIPADVAERQINTYLPTIGRLVCAPKELSWLRLSIADAPHHSLLPDLGNVISKALSRCPVPGSLSVVVAQSIPCLRQSPQPPPYTDSQDVLLNLALALLLGLYQGGTVKRPGFLQRARMYTSVHGLLTAPREAQTDFCQRNHSLILLACMEYVARVLPAHMPAQTAFLMERDSTTAVYLRRIPALCDELRQSLDTPSFVWPDVQSACAAIVDRVMRLKKSGTPCCSVQRDPPTPCLQALPSLRPFWDAPLLRGGPSLDEYRVLGQSLSLDGAVLYHVQNTIQVDLLLHTISERGPYAPHRCTPCRPICAKCRSPLSPAPRWAGRVPRFSRRATRSACAVSWAAKPPSPFDCGWIRYGRPSSARRAWETSWHPSTWSAGSCATSGSTWSCARRACEYRSIQAKNSSGPEPPSARTSPFPATFPEPGVRGHASSAPSRLSTRWSGWTT